MDNFELFRLTRRYKRIKYKITLIFDKSNSAVRANKFR